jgi:GDPmannose 4,6-dehydratase
MKRALITGITGQDGSYLTEFLLSKGYEVHGIIRRASTFNTQRIEHLYIDPKQKKANLFLHYGDLSDADSLINIVWKTQPDEVYNLGAQSHVKVSFDIPEYTGNITGLGTLRLLEAIKKSGINAKFYQASSSELFGSTPPPQSENTKFHPRSPYSVAKTYAYWITINYRESYNMFACNGILFNHESPRRGETFVTRKITRGLAAICSGKQKKLFLGNIYSKRDWGFAPEYVEMMWLMLQQENPQDFVVGTGTSYSIKDFVNEAFLYAGIELEWQGNGLEEKAMIKSIEKKHTNHLQTGNILVEIHQDYFRPADVDTLQADISKAKKILKWQPRVTFKEFVRIMVDCDFIDIKLKPIGNGLNVFKTKDFGYTNHARQAIYSL